MWGDKQTAAESEQERTGVDFQQPFHRAGDASTASQIHSGTFCALLCAQRACVHRLHTLGTSALQLWVDFNQQGILAAN